ncbi:hypothetical protein BC829DRAFT_6484 [Chytridium lagenaria]|nr:hypothetical protein BC829DRAFT_6484 [Chytridium lagenaria]
MSSSMQLLRYPISSYWLAVAMVVVVSGIPPTVIEAVDLFWRIFLLRSRAPTQQEPVAVTWTSLIWTLAILPFSDAALGEAHPDAESPEVKLHLLELRSALTRLGSRMVAVYAAFVFAAFILYIRRLEAYEDQAMRGKRQRHRTSHMGNFDTVAMSISSPTLSVSSMGSFNDHSVETHKQSRLLSHKDSPKLSTGLDKRVFEQENDVQDLGGVVAFDGGFQPRHADAEKGSLLEDLNYNDEGDSTEDKDGGFPPRRQQLFFHRMMSGVRGPSMFFQRHSGENHLGPSRLWSSPAGPPDHSGVFGLIRNFLKRWSGCSVGLHLAFHLLLGAPWAIFAVESLMGVAVVSRNTASQSAIFDNVVRPMPFINNGSVVLPSPFQVNSADGGLGQSDIGPIAVLLQPVAVSFTLAALHIVVAVILVIVSMEALPETKPPSSSSSNPNVVSSRPRRFSSSSSTSSTSSTLTGVTSLSETYGKEFDDDTGGSSLFTPDSLKIHSEAGAASFTHPSSPVVSSPLVASVVVVDPYSSVGIAETDTKADQTRRRGKRMIMPSPLLPSSFFAGPSEGSPRLQPNYGISSPKLAPSLALPSPTSMPPLLSPSAKHRVYVDGVASPAFKSDIRCFRFLNVVLFGWLLLL